jgi:hypothetical protein
MPKDEDGLAILFVCGILLFIAVFTVIETKIPPILYIALLFATTELIYLQIVRFEDSIRQTKTENDLMSTAHNLKLISIALAIIAIPSITVLLVVVYMFAMALYMILYILGILVAIVAVWLTYIYINTYPIRLRKKQIEKENNRNFNTIFD